MTTPVRMTAHTLDTIKNSITNPHHLDFTAKLSANVTVDPVYAGRVAHLNEVGEYELGLPDVSRAGHMAIFLWQSSNDPDVSNDGGIATEVDGWVAVAPTGEIKGLVASGGFELESTEYDSDQSYAPGDCLTATNANSNATTGGRLTKGVAYDVPVCGVVSRGVAQNSHRKNCIYFWSVWLPRYKA
jgi:hypothetical protein